MSDLRIAAQQGLDALYRWHMTDGETDDLMPAFEALRAALAQPAVSGELSSVSPKAQTEFMQALHGEKGALDAWLECNSEAEVRAHVLALVHQPAASGELVGYANSDELDNMLDDCTAVISAVQDGFRKTPLYAAPQPAASGEPPSVSPKAHADFVRALHGEKGALDAWLECYNETEVRAHVLALIQPAASGEPDMRHPKIQALIGGKARREIELRLVEQLLDDPDCDLSAMDMEYWHGLHDKLREKLTAATAQPAPARVPEPLTEEQMRAAFAKLYPQDDAILHLAENNRDFYLEAIGARHHWTAFKAGARAIEAAHGITPAKEAP